MAAAKSVKKAETVPVPSSDVVDAFKTYLQKAMPTYTTKDFAAGALIPVDQVEKDILILDNKIAQYKKFGFPCTKEEKQLEILSTYKDKVKGKHWPGTKSELQQAVCPHTKTVTHITATGVKMMRCMTCSKTWHAPLDIPEKKPAVYYSKGFIENLKANTKSKSILQMSADTMQPVKKEPKEIMLRAGRSEIDQKFIMRMGMISNCNVSVTRVMKPHGYGEDTALRCDKCGETVVFSDSVFVSKENGLPAKIEEFCHAHRHDAKADDKTGRLFRED